MTKAKLVLLRHGQTADNIERILTGQNDVPLTKAGEEQARVAGELIRDIPFDKVYSSPLSRSFNTASLALKMAGQELPIEKHKGILEGSTGEFSGRSMDDPEVLKFVRVYDTAPVGGESDKQLVARVQKFFDDEVLPRLKRGENVLVVSHSGTTRAFDIPLGINPPPADGTPWVRRTIPNATPLVHEYEDGVRIKSYALENPETTKANKLTARRADKFKP